MELHELDARLDEAEDRITRFVDANPDDPELLEMIASIQASIEQEAGAYLVHVRERFQCLLGSLGLIPSDNEGEPCD